MQVIYKNKSRNGLIETHEYIVKFSKPSGSYVYDCHVIFDVTAKEEMDLLLNFASEVSIRNNFTFDKLELE